MTYVVGNPRTGNVSFQTNDPSLGVEMVPGREYSFKAHLGDILSLPVGWEGELYRRVKENVESHPGCFVTGFRICHDRSTMKVNWIYNPDLSYPQAAFALTTSAIVLGLIGLGGLGFVTYNFLQLREFYEEGSEFVTLAVGGILAIGLLVAAGYAIGKLKEK